MEFIFQKNYSELQLELFDDINIFSTSNFGKIFRYYYSTLYSKTNISIIKLKRIPI